MAILLALNMEILVPKCIIMFRKFLIFGALLAMTFNGYSVEIARLFVNAPEEETFSSRVVVPVSDMGNSFTLPAMEKRENPGLFLSELEMTPSVTGRQLIHFRFSSKVPATVKIKYTYRNGSSFSKTYTVGAGQYEDCYVRITDWNNISRCLGNPLLAKPCLSIQSDNPVSVVIVDGNQPVR